MNQIVIIDEMNDSFDHNYVYKNQSNLDLTLL
jgi:hypothetical protein